MGSFLEKPCEVVLGSSHMGTTNLGSRSGSPPRERAGGLIAPRAIQRLRARPKRDGCQTNKPRDRQRGSIDPSNPWTEAWNRGHGVRTATGNRYGSCRTVVGCSAPPVHAGLPLQKGEDENGISVNRFAVLWLLGSVAAVPVLLVLLAIAVPNHSWWNYAQLIRSGDSPWCSSSHGRTA